MCKPRSRCGKSAGLVMLAPVAALLLVSAPARAQPDTMNLDDPLDPFSLMDSAIGACHDLRLNYCNVWDCSDWAYNGNGYLDVCDYVLLGQEAEIPAVGTVVAVVPHHKEVSGRDFLGAVGIAFRIGQEGVGASV